MHRTARLSALVALLALAFSPGFGCAFGEIHLDDPFNRGYSLQEAQRRYTSLVRWSEFKKAAEFVEEEHRDAFLEDAPSFRELRFTDYETGQVDIDDETGESIVEVTYYAYTPTSPLEVTIIETQHWKRETVGNDWEVTSSFAGIDALVKR